VSVVSQPTIRDAVPADASQIIAAIGLLQEYERALHDTRRSGGEIAEAYFREIEARSARYGALLVAEVDGAFIGFVCGWIEQNDEVAETEDSNRFGYVSDICVLPEWRGRRVAGALLHAIERRLAAFGGISRLRLNVLAGNAPARASYKRAGFSAYEVRYEKRMSSLIAPL
jgi:ribosomal protein S18 acetylase RimI-like enzyme